MSISVERRDFLRYGAGCAVGAGVASRSISATSETVLLSAKIVAHDGTPVANRKIAVNGRNGSMYHETNSDGVLQAEVNSETRYSLGLYKSNSDQLHAPELNGVPHIEGLGYQSVGSSDTDVGTLRVSQGYQVDMLVLDTEGNPVSNAEPGFRDDSGYGSSAYLLSTNEDGYLVIRNADFTGVEATGGVTFSVTIPGEGGKADKKYSDTFVISEPSTIRVKEGEGMTLLSGVQNEYRGKTTATSTPIPTETQTATLTSTPTPTTAPSTTSSTATNTPTTMSSTESPASATPNQRGFFQNGEAASEMSALSNPLFMTVGGFALSVAGIVLQLIRGK